MPGQMIGARVSNVGTINNASGATTFLTFDTEARDDGGLHSTSVNTGRLTAPVAGWYEIGVWVGFAANATGFRQVTIEVNANGVANTNQISNVKGAPSNSGGTQIVHSTFVFLNAGDYAEVWVTNNVATLAVSPNAFWMVRMPTGLVVG